MEQLQQCCVSALFRNTEGGIFTHRAKISMLKVQASETLGRVVDRAMQIYGGMGFSKDLPIERYYRDARIYRIFDGASEIHRSVVANSILGVELPCMDCMRCAFLFFR